ncbi:hypothetical protein [Embleya sp. NPDC050493]|uniref:hypothetical protein n=1 Tax=Embleya sp. NPDC050493 TaxID=3363989 RepID=UPI0037985484
MKVNRENVVGEALDPLDKVGLDAVGTRRPAKRLGREDRWLGRQFLGQRCRNRKHADIGLAVGATAVDLEGRHPRDAVRRRHPGADLGRGDERPGGGVPQPAVVVEVRGDVLAVRHEFAGRRVVGPEHRLLCNPGHQQTP